MDPSLNGFYANGINANTLIGINQDDAQFVDLIHTDSGFHGSSISSGTVDFWPNYGHRYQPGCLLSNIYNPILVQNGKWESGERLLFYKLKMIEKLLRQIYAVIRKRIFFGLRV